MRTIKFRGKQHKTGEWLEGDLIHYRHDVMILPLKADWFDFVPRKDNPFRLPSDKFVVDPETVGQFTGLHDKNGKEIYEGDIIKWYEIGHSDHDVLEPPEDYIKECLDVVEFLGGTFCVGREEAPSDIPVEFLTEEWQANDDDMFKWVYNTDDYPNITIDDMYICEVIGNIHDNPELINKPTND